MHAGGDELRMSLMTSINIRGGFCFYFNSDFILEVHPSLRLKEQM